MMLSHFQRNRWSLLVPYVVIGILSVLPFHDGLVVPLSAAKPTESLMGVSLPVVSLAEEGSDTKCVDIGAELAGGNGKTMVMFGTHAGDFNTIEYMQKIRAFLPDLFRKGGIHRILFVVNGEPSQCQLLVDLLDFREIESVTITILSDPEGDAGRKFGVSRGFRPDDASLSPFVKQFCSGIGIGPPWMTLPAVLPGYFGDPNGKREWIEIALKQGQLEGRWPSVLELDDTTEDILSNKFDDAPLGVSEWGRRPFELATLRLQNLIGIQIKHWSKLKPVDDRCLTQHGGCTIVDEEGKAVYSWVDRGLCDVPDMQDILEILSAEDP